MATGNSCKNLSVIQQSNQKLWPFSAVIPVWRIKTSLQLERQDLLFKSRVPYILQGKTASRNSCKNLSIIQRWDQKLWLFSAFILDWCDKTSSSNVGCHMYYKENSLQKLL
jgi:hypothetical protein